MENLPDHYKWDDNSSRSLTEELNYDKYKKKAQELLVKKDLKIEDIKEPILNAADSCPIRETRNKKRITKKDKPWFNNECHSIKKEIMECGKTLRSTPADVDNREKIYFLKRKLRNLIKKNKTNYKMAVVNDMCSDLSKGKQKEYWKHLQKLGDSDDEHAYIPNFTLVNHFKELLQHENVSLDYSNQVKKTGTLDHPISHEELESGSKNLKAGKGTGIDTVRNEMVIPLVQAYPDLVLRAFNDILIEYKPLCKDWLHSLITAIHKKGAKEDPSNYRRISLMSCLGKLFLTIINNRLTTYSLENGLLSPGQLGFVKGNRTSDPHIILHNLLQKYCHKGKRKLYGCFVDFSKAFHSIPRDILLNKLKKKGIDGRVRTLYLEDTASVKIGNKYSPPFKTNTGVRQGCILSPLLFNLFLADLQPILDG